MFKEFKEFAMKGSLIDIAVGFVMGAAFKEVVTSFTGGIISPLVGLVFKTDLKNLKYILSSLITSATKNGQSLSHLKMHAPLFMRLMAMCIVGLTHTPFRNQN